MKLTKQMTKADLILIVLLVLLSVAALIALAVKGMSSADEYISIQVDGVEVQTLALDESTEGKQFAIKSDFGENIIQIKDQKVSVKSASCPDQLCVHQGEIQNIGQILVCLPNRLLVEIESNEQQAELDGVVK